MYFAAGRASKFAEGHFLLPFLKISVESLTKAYFRNGEVAFAEAEHPPRTLKPHLGALGRSVRKEFPWFGSVVGAESGDPCRA